MEKQSPLIQSKDAQALNQTLFNLALLILMSFVSSGCSSISVRAS